MEDLSEHKKNIVKIGKTLYKKGFVPGTSGNISVRHNDRILITPSGSTLGNLNAKDLVIIDNEGNNLEKNKKPSSEKAMHAEIYKTRPDISCIIHAHPPKSTAFAVAGIPLDAPVLAEAILSLGCVPLANYATPSSNKLATIVAGYFLDHDAVLLANHGVVIGGNKLIDVYYKLETLELYAEIILWTKVLGKSTELDQDHIQELIQIKENAKKIMKS